MDTYIFECLDKDKQNIIEIINNNIDDLIYCSPVLPIIAIECLNVDLINEIQENYHLNYLIKNPVNGEIQDTDGSLLKNGKSISITPSLDFSLLRNMYYTGWGTTVAVLDSGVNESWVSEHQDFTGYGSTPIINHGTKVANIIKESAPGSQIISYKVCHEHSVELINVLKAIDTAVKKADILNLSLGFGHQCSNEQPCALCAVINHYTQNESKVFVVAAGNNSTEGSVQCPGNAQEAITVGALTPKSQRIANYSSKGRVGEKKPNIIAPGTIYYKHELDEGTSFSAPVITGTSASFYNIIDKKLSKLKTYLYSTANKIEAPEHHQGFGLLNLEKLVEVVRDDESNIKSERQRQN